jgi:hypothetical protein
MTGKKEAVEREAEPGNAQEVGTSPHVAPPVDEAGPVPEGGAEPYPPETASELEPVSPFAPVHTGGDPGTHEVNPPPEPEVPEGEVRGTGPKDPDEPVEDEELPDDDD